MPKRSVAYIKPEEPKFLKKLKEQAGYVEGPTINTKVIGYVIVRDCMQFKRNMFQRESAERPEIEDFEDTVDEQPTVVVLQSGDLTAEEVAEINKQSKKEDQSPADLTKPIVFKPKLKDKKKDENVEVKKSKRIVVTEDNKKSKGIQRSLLSFDRDEDETD